MTGLGLRLSLLCIYSKEAAFHHRIREPTNFCPMVKPPESTSSELLRSATAKTAAFQTRIRPFGLFYTLYTPAEGRSTSSEAGSPLFWSKSRFCPLTLSNRSVSQETGRFELLRNYQDCPPKRSNILTVGFIADVTKKRSISDCSKKD